MAIRYKNNGRYAYETHNVWNSEKKKYETKWRYLGVVDENGAYKKGRPVATPVETEPACRRFYGATYLLDRIGDKLGIADDLRRCFPQCYKQLLSIAYYLILEDSGPLSRFEKWAITHKHPYDKDIPSQRSSEIFMGLDALNINDFFRLQGKRRIDKEHWVYDITSISSYSEVLKQVQYGHNKEEDKLPQINLALVFGEQSGLPFYYRKLAGNISDVTTVKNLLADFDVLGFKKVKLVMDRGFFSVANINDLMKEHLKFLVATKISLKVVKEKLDSIYDSFTFEHYNEDHRIYSTTVPGEWEYVQARPYKGDAIKSKRRIYIHLYYNIDRVAEEQNNFDRKLMELRRELVSGKRMPEHEKQYAKYFTVKKTPKRGIKVTVNEEAVKETKRYYGYFALMSNEKMDSITALELYRNKDVVEKAFGNLKERLNLRRALVSSEKSLDGKLFVQFVALIYLSHIKKMMSVKNLGKHYTMAGILDKLDVIECFEYQGKKMRIGEITQKQIDIYANMEVENPTNG